MKDVFRSAIGVRDVKEALIIGVVGEDGTIGYGECSARTDPYYSYEYVDSIRLTLQRFFSDEMIGSTAGEALRGLARSRVRGWPFARAALEEAVCDWNARALGENGDEASGLHLAVGATLSVPTDVSTLAESMESRFEAGYERVRIKAHVDVDWPGILAVLRVFSENRRCIAMDFNGSLDPTSDRCDEVLDQIAEALDPAFVFIEQPYAPESLLATARLRRRGYPIPISLDESIDTIDTLEVALELGAIDVCNIKVGRVGGPARAAAMARWCVDHGLRAHVGGMFETGIGRWSTARQAGALLPGSCHDFTVPGDYLEHDVVHDSLLLDKAARAVRLDDRPVRVDAEALAGATMREWSSAGSSEADRV
ncbi:O-succinylbenzoate synthase [Saccharothrix carnea]|uniref:O-succinylbenzoate synthase n=2 Tax=Saccharothrix carnea TaxID=1280637 RepID=A0A2P8I608_SACCR|nr:O-succinylbenzoate synthase [Saccharothrix carnea]